MERRTKMRVRNREKEREINRVRERERGWGTFRIEFKIATIYRDLKDIKMATFYYCLCTQRTFPVGFIEFDMLSAANFLPF